MDASVRIPPGSSVGVGSIILAGVVLTSDVALGRLFRVAFLVVILSAALVRGEDALLAVGASVLVLLAGPRVRRLGSMPLNYRRTHPAGKRAGDPPPSSQA